MSLAEPVPLRNDGLRFDLHGSEREILDGADLFARKELYPLAARMDAEEWWPDGSLRENRPGRIFRRDRVAGRGRCRRRSHDQRPGAAGFRPLEPRAGAQLGRAREPVPQQYPAQRERGTAPEILAGPVQRPVDRRARPDRAGCRFGRAGLDAHHGAPRRRPLHPERHARSTSPTARWPTCCWSTPRPTPELGAKGISAFIVEKDIPGFKVAQKLDEDGLSRQPDRRAGVRRLPRAGREPGRPGECAASRIVMSGLDLERAMIAPLVPRHRRARARSQHRLCQDPRAVRQADRRIPDDPGQARRHVRLGRDDADLHLSRARPRSTTWRSAAAGAARSMR